LICSEISITFLYTNQQQVTLEKSQRIIQYLKTKEKSMKKTLFAALALCLLFSVFQVVLAQDTDVAESPAALETEEVAMEPAVKITIVKPFYYAALEMTGSYDQHAEAFNTLYGMAGKLMLDMSQPSFGIYYNNPQNTPEAELKWELGLPVSEDQKLEEPLKLKKWEFKLLATKNYKGSFSSEAMEASYAAFFQWIAENKYAPAGPMMEKYLGQPTMNEKGEWCGEIEMLLPVQKIMDEPASTE
jgi:AraC family transcriptional regulator